MDADQGVEVDNDNALVRPSVVRRSKRWRSLPNVDPTGGQEKQSDDPMLDQLRSSQAESEDFTENKDSPGSVLFEDVPMETSDNSLIRPSKLRESLRRKKKGAGAATKSASQGDVSNVKSAKFNGAHENTAKPTLHSGSDASKKSDLRSKDSQQCSTSIDVDKSPAQNMQNGAHKTQRTESTDGSASPTVTPVIKGSRSTPQGSQRGQRSRLRSRCPDSVLSPSLPSSQKVLSASKESKDQDIQHSKVTHIQKTWGSPEPQEGDIPPNMDSLMPQTDVELRKAYFRQLEEIQSLKEQVAVKDKRIRQLEMELRILKTIKEPDESNC